VKKAITTEVGDIKILIILSSKEMMRMIHRWGHFCLEMRQYNWMNQKFSLMRVGLKLGNQQGTRNTSVYTIVRKLRMNRRLRNQRDIGTLFQQYSFNKCGMSSIRDKVLQMR
jgi:hypothetical protein